ncbi:MAG: flavodoxin-dependent (E)-4-hydroxy-3-methylbut-2-enyl-diphosphate synthase [Firmicutes bacterium]|nr:flavodoxin-dependent (E)-4-hydroxy-3-methylbut-2-enyl-diphosphate synthase [Bacillota bacterium]
MRRKTRQLYIGDIGIGSEHPISVQSMLNTKTADIEGSLRQIEALAAAGCEICRLAVPDTEAAEALKLLVKRSPLPLVADIHFDYRLALASIKAGVGAIRLNPGNIGGEARVQAVAEAAKASGIPIRIGVNGGSLEKDILEKYQGVTAQGIAESAMRHAAMLEKCGFYDIKISAKASSVPLTVEANRQIAGLCDYPLHLGLTEAGGLRQGTVKSSVALGILLSEGLGDTIRVSLTADPVEEIAAAKEILNALELKPKSFEIISCPTCGRTESDLIGLAENAERALKEIKLSRPLKIAVMGCAVNGPGEAREADYGIACGKGEGLLFSKGEIIGKYAQEDLVRVLLAVITEKEL